MKEKKEKERDEFIALLQRAVDVTIKYAPPVPALDDFFNPKEKDPLIHSKAFVEFSFRAGEVDK